MSDDAHPLELANQQSLDELAENFPWHDAFVREAHLFSPTYVDHVSRSTVAPDSPWLVRLVVCSSAPEAPAIELVFEDVEEFSLLSRQDLSLKGSIRSDGVEVSLDREGHTCIRANRLRYRVLGQIAWGNRTSYGLASPFDDGGFLIDEN